MIRTNTSATMTLITTLNATTPSSARLHDKRQACAVGCSSFDARFQVGTRNDSKNPDAQCGAQSRAVELNELEVENHPGILWLCQITSHSDKLFSVVEA
ncbi:hypothetical protein RRG08_042519 [Elysia crispata]|uniref:Uncharacterized protein n=1 Tax=Elysia crispata TaxID=231223 RepID=A0AAE0XPW1_9GAST|nr:hypothetical protein RRG08_042519 [Elysia crispata]